MKQELYFLFPGLGLRLPVTRWQIKLGARSSWIPLCFPWGSRSVLCKPTGNSVK